MGVFLFPDRLGKLPIQLPRKWQEFRKFLLNAATTPFDIYNILPYTEMDEFSLKRCPDSFHSLMDSKVPASLYRWNACSRRVFNISNDLKTLLENTDVADITVNDVPWPFETFVITCQDEASPNGLCWLVKAIRTDPKQIGNFSIQSFPTDYPANLSLSSLDRQAMLKLFKERKGEQLARRMVPYLDRWSSYQVGSFSTPCDISVNTLVEKHFGGTFKTEGTELGGPIDADKTLSELEKKLNLAIGLSLYLTTITSSREHLSSWTKLSQTRRLPDPRAITNEADVCTVSCEHVLTPEDRDAFEGRGKREGHNTELCAHFRRGHWRKPPGKGNDPNAEKIVWVRPTLVRRDRLAEGQLPGGAQSNA